MEPTGPTAELNSIMKEYNLAQVIDEGRGRPIHDHVMHHLHCSVSMGLAAS